jgi:hypothetical protein
MPFSSIPSSDITYAWSLEPDVTVTISLANIEVTDEEGTLLGTLGNLAEGSIFSPYINQIQITWGDSQNMDFISSSEIQDPLSHKYTSKGAYVIKVAGLNILTDFIDEYGGISQNSTSGASITSLDLSTNVEWTKGWQAQSLAVPLIGGNDGYGAIRGATLRRDYVQPYPTYDTQLGGYGALPAAQVVVHQINTTQANPQIYTPSKTVVAGQQWRISCDIPTVNTGNVAAGTTTFRWSVDWYNSSNTYLSSTDGLWVSDASMVVGTNGNVVGARRPTHIVTVPTGATKMTPTLEMKTLSAVNAWAPQGFKYEKLIT